MTEAGRRPGAAVAQQGLSGEGKEGAECDE